MVRTRSGRDTSRTYVRTDEGWLYLAVVIDLWSRTVIGWSMSPRMTAQLACGALQMALWRRKSPRNVIVHSDRGSQYCSVDYQTLLKRHNLRDSMSAKGCCYDNACVESFFHSLKVECPHGEHFISREIMQATVLVISGTAAFADDPVPQKDKTVIDMSDSDLVHVQSEL